MLHWALVQGGFVLPPHFSLYFPELGVILGALWQVNIPPGMEEQVPA